MAGSGMRRVNRQYLGLEGVGHGLEPPPPAWQLEVQSPIPLTVQGKVTNICGGESQLLPPQPTWPHGLS